MFKRPDTIMHFHALDKLQQDSRHNFWKVSELKSFAKALRRLNMKLASTNNGKK